MTSVQLSYAAEQVRRYDRDRFLTALFAPPERREALMVLYAFNVEVAKTRESVREHMAGLVRLQWWREVLAGERPEEAARNPVAEPLLATARAFRLPGEPFERLLDAREHDLSNAPFADMAEMEAYAADTAAGVTRLALHLLDAADEATLRAGDLVGTAWGLLGLVRGAPFLLSIGRVTLPESLLAEAGSSAEDMLAGRAPRAAMAQASARLGERVRSLLAEARRIKVPRRALPALLPARLADFHLKTLEAAGWDPFDPRVQRARPLPLRLALANWLGRM